MEQVENCNHIQSIIDDIKKLITDTNNYQELYEYLDKNNIKYTNSCFNTNIVYQENIISTKNCSDFRDEWCILTNKDDDKAIHKCKVDNKIKVNGVNQTNKANIMSKTECLPEIIDSTNKGMITVR